MKKNNHLPQAVKNALQAKGIHENVAQSQLERFEKGFPDLIISRPATPGDGIVRIPADKEKQYSERFDQAQKEGRVMKFVPASGAASRMFKSLQAMLNDEKRLTREYLEAADGDEGRGGIEDETDNNTKGEIRGGTKDGYRNEPGSGIAGKTRDEDALFTRTFSENLEQFAFYDDLVDALRKQGMSVEELKTKQDYRTLLSFVLEDAGLGLASLPKALIPFHRYESHNRTPLEEHLAEARAYALAGDGKARLHFTISPEHKEAFDRRLETVRPLFESAHISLNVETSFQKPETDTIAVNPENRPFLDNEGNAVFRPGGHGALLVNLEELKGDIVFIKNIDNVVPDRIRDTTVRYKKLLGGYLLTLQDNIFFYLKELDREGERSTLLDEMAGFLRDELHVGPPRSGLSQQAMVQWLHDRLNRPLRVCGMVKNEGEPGGGPFFVEDGSGSGNDSDNGIDSGSGYNSGSGNDSDNGIDSDSDSGYNSGSGINSSGVSTSLQIVESAQVNMDDPGQKEIFDSSTHFNPVDLACGLRDYQGRAFKLEPFRDPETGFISEKSYQGRELKALELPGLWNGSMARWNTVFVEVPAETFHPVKTVNDLLREEHKNE